MTVGILSIGILSIGTWSIIKIDQIGECATKSDMLKKGKNRWPMLCKSEIETLNFAILGHFFGLLQKVMLDLLLRHHLARAVVHLGVVDADAAEDGERLEQAHVCLVELLLPLLDGEK